MIIVKLYLIHIATQTAAIAFVFLLVFISLFFEKRKREADTSASNYEKN